MELLELNIPKDIENMQLPDPELLEYYLGIQNRIIWIEGDIDETLLRAVKKILQWNKADKDIPIEERKPIKICVFSYGGSVDSTFTFLDVCKLSKTPIVTINCGVAMSAGILIFLAGHKRYALEKSQFLIHSGSGGAVGTFEQTEAAMQNYKKTIEVMREYILDRTNIDTKLFGRNKSKEWYIYANDAVNLGICDKVIDDIDDVIS